jgi:hypothetical protein
MRVVVVNAKEGPVVTEVTSSLKTWQSLVSGYIEVVPLTADADIVIIVNEEGKLQGLEETLFYGGDILVGTVVFVGGGEEDFESLTDEQIKTVLTYCENNLVR